METLSNGAEVILRGTDRNDEEYCLCITDSGFVTWAVDQEGNAYWGHYWSHTLGGLIDAVRDFRTRTNCDLVGTQLGKGQQP